MKKFDRLFNTIMEDVKSSKIKAKKVIKEDYDQEEDYGDDFDSILTNRLKKAGITVDDETYDYFYKVEDSGDIDEDQLRGMTDEEFKEWAQEQIEDWNRMTHAKYDKDSDLINWFKQLKQLNMDNYDTIRNNLQEFYDNWDSGVCEFERNEALLTEQDWREMGCTKFPEGRMPNNIAPEIVRYMSWCEDYDAVYYYDVAKLWDIDVY